MDARSLIADIMTELDAEALAVDDSNDAPPARGLSMGGITALADEAEAVHTAILRDPQREAWLRERAAMKAEAAASLCKGLRKRR